MGGGRWKVEKCEWEGMCKWENKWEDSGKLGREVEIEVESGNVKGSGRWKWEE
jgi:hypothetical protein